MSDLLSNVPELVTKGEFAALIGVTPGRVSQMIAAGQIDAAAIEGDGQRAKIRVDLARAQLRRRLDVAQSLGNGLGTRLDDERRSPAAMPAPTPTDVVTDQIRLEKLRQAQFVNRKLAEDELARVGVYVRADQTSAAMAKLAGSLITVFEGGLNDLAQAVAAKFELPARDVLHALRQEFRAVRTKAADSAKRHASSLPALIPDEVADASDPALGEA